jgi:hypothetical protein
MRNFIFALGLAACSIAPAMADVDLGLDLGATPRLVEIPGYPVSYAPDLNTNYFVYDDKYWVFDGAAWYEGPRYNGPWQAVDPTQVPTILQQVPVEFYNRPPVYYFQPHVLHRFGDGGAHH